MIVDLWKKSPRWLHYLSGLLLCFFVISPLPLLAKGATQEIVPQEIRYHLADAGEVMLVWGGDDWAVLPEEIRPPGTFIENNVMHLPMTRQDDTFMAEILVPVGVTLNYGFQIRKTQQGADITWVWDGDYQATSPKEGVIDIQSALKLLARQEIRYHTLEAGEVFLGWGINNWQIVPEALRPAGTVVNEGVMRTPMVREGNVFTTQVEVPVGTTIDYGFLVTKTPGGADIEVWDADQGQDYHTLLKADGMLEIGATPNLVRQAAVSYFDLALQWRGFVTLLIGILVIISLGIVSRRRVAHR